MPAYRAAGVTARLSASDLQETITKDMEIKKGPPASASADAVQDLFRKKAYLQEEPVPFPHDPRGFQVGFVGDAPFLQVQAGANLFDNETASTGEPNNREFEMDMSSQGPFGRLLARTQHLSDLDQEASSSRQFDLRPYLHSNLFNFNQSGGGDQVPKALCLHVNLSEQTFLPDFDNGKPQHLKLDVFFNGMLVNSALILQRDMDKVPGKSRHQIFAGTRVDYIAERPWVILPPDYRPQMTNRSRVLGVQERWRQICQALLKEAEARGVDLQYQPPPSAKYLELLATTEMPASVSNMQNAGGKTFGIIDVVITHGEGRKVNNGTQYLQGPLRLIDERYEPFGNDMGMSDFEESYVERGPDAIAHKNAGNDTDLACQTVTRQVPRMEPMPLLHPSLFPTLAPNAYVQAPRFDPNRQNVPINGTIATPQEDPFLDPYPVGEHSTVASPYFIGDQSSIQEGHAPPYAHHLHGPLVHFDGGGGVRPRLLGGPPPAVGMFSVGSVPESAATPLNALDTSLPRPSMLIRRLVIYGKDRRVVRDVTWPRAVRVPINREYFMARAQGRLPDDKSARGRSEARQDIVESPTTPPPTSDMMDIDTVRVPTAKRSAHHYMGPARKTKNPRPQSPAMSPLATRSRMRSKAKATPQRALYTVCRDCGGNHRVDRPHSTIDHVDPVLLNLPANQGPAAIPVQMDDPEALLRRRSSRRAAPASRAPPIAQPPRNPTPSVPKIDLFDDEDSSLSSAPTSPTPTLAKAPQGTPKTRGTSKTKPTAGLRMPMASPCPTGLRMAGTRRPKNTIRAIQHCIDNPELNEGCVIQYAESEEGENVLRQVRAERQGVFREEGIVVGMRFFVPA
ncbi:hypothetical protein EJ04DRAFT_305375 [Polyplosphaeria fusca]|uniref:Uncharacterized protein n=1 Tax=Polyplosphaeria fusca TaxID=682080 RepID=A0A9P4QXF0_9PLEO|nr:hypothetical protein EJ04DRAFT_305375 [Polyplosphaeria fusca]